MGLQELMQIVGDAAHVRRVFGEPVEREGTLVIPVATVRAGAGGGVGKGPQENGEGEGGGYGFAARPLGIFVLRDDRVEWRPALDVGKVILGGQVVAVTALLVIRSLMRRR
ncbi:MAG: spore germination protein GerW family protein [Mycobacteriales bacterium]